MKGSDLPDKVAMEMLRSTLDPVLYARHLQDMEMWLVEGWTLDKLEDRLNVGEVLRGLQRVLGSAMELAEVRGYIASIEVEKVVRLVWWVACYYEQKSPRPSPVQRHMTAVELLNMTLGDAVTSSTERLWREKKEGEMVSWRAWANSTSKVLLDTTGSVKSAERSGDEGK